MSNIHNETLLETIYDVWFTGSYSTTSAYDSPDQYYTGSIKPLKFKFLLNYKSKN